MPSQKYPSPQKLWDCLLDIDPNHFNGGSPHVEMLGSYFHKYADREASQAAKLEFQNAIHYWDDEQTKEFLGLLIEEPLSSVPSKDLHEGLRKVYQIIFERSVDSQQEI